MKDERGRMQQKTRSQTFCSDDECVMYVTWPWDMACISKKTLGVSAVELGGHKALQTVHNSVGSAIRKTRVLVPPGFCWHKIPVLGGRMCPQSRGTHGTRRGSREGAPTQARKGH